jgi:3-hydroxybutyryl-CoA dehydrogenase
MNASDIQKVTVIGAGVMGQGIAHVAAQAGYQVFLQDINEGVLEKARTQIQKNLDRGIEKKKISETDREQTLKNLQTVTDMNEALRDAHLVIEAIPESLPLKIELFGKMSRKVSEETILATNTSSLSIQKIAAASQKPDRILGMHFFNPPHILKLMELVHAPRTDEKYLEIAKAVARKMGREIIVVKDSPGFATSRLGVVLGLEAMRMVEQGVAKAEDIDRAMELGYNHPMGPLRLSDLVGLDTRLSIADYLYKEFGKTQYQPPVILREKVAQGQLGKKSGQGFYHWEDK